ncbi:MAG: dTMP kinase [Desulfocucumaceae bacterium]
MKKGLFVVFEGIDGAGKTTQVALLAKYLGEKGHRVMVTRDPGGTPLGEELRNVLLHSAFPIDPVAETLMYAAARAQHVAEKLLPALGEGIIVISDRFYDSMCAYQGSGRGVDDSFLEKVNRFSCQGLSPDITILLDMEPEAALSRLTRPADRMEGEGLGFLVRVRAGYLSRSHKSSGLYIVLDASLPVKEIALRATRAVEKLLEDKI